MTPLRAIHPKGDFLAARLETSAPASVGTDMNARPLPALEVLIGPWSPFARKVAASAVLLGLAEDVSWRVANMSTFLDCQEAIDLNPLGKIPVLRTPDQVLSGSTLICSYLQHLAGDTSLVPDGEARWQVLKIVELTDGLLEAGLLARNEGRRPDDRQWSVARDFYLGKVERALGAVNAAAPDFSKAKPSLAEIASGCAASWLDARLPDLKWREEAPQLAGWWMRAADLACFTRTAPPLGPSGPVAAGKPVVA